MNFPEATKDALRDIAHEDSGRDVKTMWSDLREITDKYSFKCRYCKKNKLFKNIDNTLRWFVREDNKNDQCDIWTKCKMHIKEDNKCINCKHKI